MKFHKTAIFNLLGVVLGLISLSNISMAESLSGEQIYLQSCMVCHSRWQLRFLG